MKKKIRATLLGFCLLIMFCGLVEAQSGITCADSSLDKVSVDVTEEEVRVLVSLAIENQEAGKLLEFSPLVMGDQSVRFVIVTNGMRYTFDYYKYEGAGEKIVEQLTLWQRPDGSTGLIKRSYIVDNLLTGEVSSAYKSFNAPDFVVKLYGQIKIGGPVQGTEYKPYWQNLYNIAVRDSTKKLQQ